MRLLQRSASEGAERKRIGDGDGSALGSGEMPALNRGLDARRDLHAVNRRPADPNVGHPAGQPDVPIVGDLSGQRRILRKLTLVATLNLIEVRVHDLLDFAPVEVTLAPDGLWRRGDAGAHGTASGRALHAPHLVGAELAHGLGVDVLPAARAAGDAERVARGLTESPGDLEISPDARGESVEVRHRDGARGARRAAER